MDPRYYPIEQGEDGSFSIFYTGTAPTPVTIKLVPRFSLGEVPIKIVGLSDDPIQITMFSFDTENGYTIISDDSPLDEDVIEGVPKTSLLMNDIIVIDGEKNTVTLNDESIITQVIAPQFPRLKPGENNIVITPVGSLGIEIRYKVRYI